MNTTPPQTLVNSEALVKRYKDAYTVAAVINGFGIALKYLAYLLGTGMFIVSFALLDSFHVFVPKNPGAACGISLVIGVLFWLVLYVLGIVTACQGQVLRANLDEAVYVCPFFTDANKIIAANLPTSRNA